MDARDRAATTTRGGILLLTSGETPACKHTRRGEAAGDCIDWHGKVHSHLFGLRASRFRSLRWSSPPFGRPIGIIGRWVRGRCVRRVSGPRRRAFQPPFDLRLGSGATNDFRRQMIIAFGERARSLAGSANNPIAEQLTMDSFSLRPNAVQTLRMKLGLSPANVSCVFRREPHQSRSVSIDASRLWCGPGGRWVPGARQVRRERGVETARRSPD